MVRPCTAAEIWERDWMRHALVRIYLYSTLSTEDISLVLTAVAQHRIGAHVASGKRSTAAQLKKLLAEEGLGRKSTPRNEQAACALNGDIAAAGPVLDISDHKAMANT
ncbi:hypothetical protein OQA88_12583 [Cercophora sp. LCS_1]